MHFKKAYVSDDSYNHVMSLSNSLLVKLTFGQTLYYMISCKAIIVYYSVFAVEREGRTSIDTIKLPLGMYLFKNMGLKGIKCKSSDSPLHTTDILIVLNR